MNKISILLSLFIFGTGALRASTVATTTTTSTTNGVTTTLVEAPAQTTPYYRLVYMTVVRQGASVNVLKSLLYSPGQTLDADNIFCATTYAEIKAEATTLGIATIPKQKTGQP